MKKTALVLGGGGFIGGHLAKRLKSEGYWVRVVDIKFHYSPDMNISMEDRLINPLGFQASQFLITDELYNYN